MKQLLLILSLFVLTGPLAAQTAAPTLIPFQGRLTDQNGVAYTNNQYTIVFQLYDQAVGGTLLWSERHEKVGVLNGMVNLFLGSIATLTNLSFSSTRYLGITVDGDNNPNTPDPEMVPRQMIIPAFFAKTAENATKLGGYDWSPLFGANNPSGYLQPSKIQPQSITGNLIALNSIGATHLQANAITSLGGATITLGSLPLDRLMPRGTNGNGVGQVYFSADFSQASLPPATVVAPNELKITMPTTGRPVFLMLQPKMGSGGRVVINGANYFYFNVYRNGNLVAQCQWGSPNGPIAFNPGVLSLDLPPVSASSTYSVELVNAPGQPTGVPGAIFNMILVAFEL